MSSGEARFQDENGNHIPEKEEGNSVSVDSDSYYCYQNENDQLDTPRSPICEDGTPFGLPDVESQLPTVAEERESPGRGKKNQRTKRQRSASLPGHNSVKDVSDDVDAHSSSRRGSDDSPSLQQKNCRRRTRPGAQGKPKKIAGKQSDDTLETSKHERDLGYKDKTQKHSTKTGKKSRGEGNKRVTCQPFAEQPCHLAIKPPSERPANQNLINSVSVDSDSYWCYQNEKDQLGTPKSPICEDGTPFGLPDVESQLPTVAEERESPGRGKKNQRMKRHRSASLPRHNSVKDVSDDVGAHSSSRRGSDDSPSLQQKNCRHRTHRGAQGKPKKIAGKQSGDTLETSKHERDLGYRDKTQKHSTKTGKKSRGEGNKRVTCQPFAKQPCHLVIKPPSERPVNQDLITRYLSVYLGDEITFHHEKTKPTDGGCVEFTFVFQNYEQGRRAEQILQENIKEIGEKIEISILSEETRNAMFLVECSAELQNEMTAIEKQHAKKIEKISRRIKGLRVKKHISPIEFEKICSERKVLKHKKEELESQLQQFRRFDVHITSILGAQRGLPTSSVQSTVKKLREALGRECHQIEVALPIYAKKTEITQLVKDNQVCVILGETGSGKSTQMTQYLYEAGFAEKGLIVCTQPRKVAATSLASHVAREMGSTVGKLVGCRVGGNILASKETGIVYATDHILLNECLKDSKLSKYSCIIIDEAHERSLYSDLLLGMIKKNLIQRPELRVVITSATINPALFVAYFDQCPVLKVSGRMFPVDVIWKDGPSSNVENYVLEAVNTVQEIHHKEDKGDILVFLTSPVETQRACEMLAKVVRDTNLVCLPLHGKLSQEEQKKVFKENGHKRKVIFATNCAETSITIPGIRYVVDTGMVKEMKFEPKRNKSSLEVTTINKSSAEQRKGRAGRTQAGKCFRLYSQEDYEAMEDQLKPEILRVHLGQAVLKLMELGIEDIRDFEFVESPPLDSINRALELLNSLGAMANGKLTQLGGKIARVPVEPRLGKVIFEGIEKGVGADALALAAIATAGGSIFFRMGSEEEKQEADSRKVCFCMDGGDLLTLLEVYRQYLKQPKRLRERNKWAVANRLNAKSLRVTDETIKELKLTLKHELKITIPDTLQQDSKNDVKLQKILLSCYATNLCVFTGHEKAGYRVLSSNQCVQVHPSSALKFIGATPQFIVFDQLLKTSREFVVNITPVEETWLREMISTGALKYDLDHLLSTVLTKNLLLCSPEIMNLTFGGYRRRNLNQIEEKVSKSCDDSLVVLEEDKLRGQIKIFAPEQHTVKALSVMGSILEEKRKMLRNEEREEPLREEFPGSRIVWGQGGEIREVLMQDMYRTVTVGEIEDGYEAAVKDHLKSFGDVVEEHSFKEQNGKIRLFVTYKKSQDALRAVKSSSDSSLDIDIKVQPRHSTGHGHQTRFSQLKVRVKWLRRPSKGTGSVQFFNDEDFFYTLRRISSLFIRSRKVIFQADEIHEQQIFVRGLHPETSKEDVTFAIEDRLPSVKVMNVFIHRIAEFETEDETLVMQKTSLEKSLSNFATQGNFSVYVGKPSSKYFEGYANLTFQNPEEGQAAIRGLNGVNIPGIGVITLHPNLLTVLSCARNVYAVIENELNETISKLESIFASNLIMKAKNEPTDKRVWIEIQSNSMEHFVCATTVITEIVNGDKIDCKISKDLEILLLNSAKDVLQAIQKDTGTVISQDRRNQAVRIHGSEANRESAKRAINKFLDDFITGKSHPWQIQLRGPNKPRGLLKALYKRFGANLQGLRDIGGVQKIDVEFRNHVLKIVSSDEAEELINNCVAECCKNLPQEVFPLQQDHHTQLTCGICLCDLDSTADVYRLACCGHAYDKSCVILQVKSPEFPLKCVVEQCGEPLVWKDFQNLLDDCERKKLALTALDEYVKRNPEIVKHCPTADCGMVYRVSIDGRLFVCDACLAQTCTSCHVQWHNGLTCAMFKSEKQVEGRLMEWMMKDPGNRKNCPKCKTPIEKNEGCNHMTCSQCKTHMCWLCLKVFPTGEGVYDHQKYCPNKTAA